MITRLFSASTFWLILAVLCLYFALLSVWYAEIFVFVGLVFAFVALGVLVWKLSVVKGRG